MVGAKISSTQGAIDNHKNQLTTGALTTADLQNPAGYDADSTSIGGGYSFQGGLVRELFNNNGIVSTQKVTLSSCYLDAIHKDEIF